MTQVTPNSVPRVGGAVVMEYGDLPHVAYIEAIETDGVLVSESNYVHCQYDNRLISWQDVHLRGYYYPLN